MNIGDGTPASPIPSATVLMLRDSPTGLEVFLLKRHGLSEVLGGAYVFPGGKVDSLDFELVDRLDQTPDALRLALNETGQGGDLAAALYVAAVRETFEESGVLFAAVGPEAIKTTQALYRARHPFLEVVAGLGASLDTAGLLPWSRWITPRNSVRARKHFDARFFVAAVPPGQEPVHDQHEMTGSAWLSPIAALHEYWEARIQLAAPQIMSLIQLSRFNTVTDILEAASTGKPLHIQPEVFEEDGVQMVCYPGDPRHSLTSRLLPGPTRLYWRNDRYEPEGGLEALLS